MKVESAPFAIILGLAGFFANATRGRAARGGHGYLGGTRFLFSCGGCALAGKSLLFKNTGG
jgi:hypothetical protein